MHPIIINREPQIVRDHKEFKLEDGGLTLAKLREYVTEDDIFSISETDEGIRSTTMLYVTRKRLETPEELEERVKKEEKYMENYRNYHANKNKLKNK